VDDHLEYLYQIRLHEYQHLVYQENSFQDQFIVLKWTSMTHFP
jgi:hypothetical protein